MGAKVAIRHFFAGIYIQAGFDDIQNAVIVEVSIVNTQRRFFAGAVFGVSAPSWKQ